MYTISYPRGHLIIVRYTWKELVPGAMSLALILKAPSTTYGVQDTIATRVPDTDLL